MGGGEEVCKVNRVGVWFLCMLYMQVLRLAGRGGHPIRSLKFTIQARKSRLFKYGCAGSDNLTCGKGSS